MEADLSAWSDFFVASAGATAALAGGIIASTVAAVINGWVLMVEIRR